MIHVFAEAGKNTRNAVESMRKILLIDKGSSSIHNFKKSLSHKGYLLINEHNLGSAATHLKGNDIDLITIDRLFLSGIGNSNRFIRLAAEIPKIILADARDIRQKSLCPKDRLTALISDPVSFRDYISWTERLIKEKTLEDEKKQLQAKLRIQDNTLHFYHDLIHTSASTIDIRKSLNSILEKTKKMTGARACSLLLNDEHIIETVPLRRSKKINRFMFKKGGGIAGWVLDKGIPLIVQDVRKDKRFRKSIDDFSGIKINSLLCAPLKIRNRVVGVLRLINKKNGNPFTRNEMSLVIDAANHAAMAIERSFLYEKLKNDDLTSLFNMRYFNEALEMEIERATRYDSPFSILFMDIDNFKEINDRHGHLIGSRVLVEVAQILQKNLRKIDVVSRYGGDEYVMILALTSQKGSFLLAERLRKIIERTVFLKQDGYSIRLTASLGVATFPDNAKNKEDLMKLADNAMYRSKYSSKNTVFAAS